MTTIGWPTRAAEWNRQRYPQEFCAGLTQRILEEEVRELATAMTDVAKVDAVADILFAAVGALWKLKMPVAILNELFSTPVLFRIPLICTIAIEHVINMSVEKKTLDVWVLLLTSVREALVAFNELNLAVSLDEIMHIVCDSNDTRDATMRKAYQKYGDVKHKGTDYVSPTIQLTRLLHHAAAQERRR